LVPAAWACRENAIVVFDASGSMALFRDGRPKIVMAHDAAASVLPDVTQHRPTGLITYSGDRGPACADVRLRVRPRLGSSGAILAEIAKIKPSGATPLSDAVAMAAETLKSYGEPGIIVLVTDGLENCGGNACALGTKLQAMAANLRIHVISFYLHGRAKEKITCLADMTGGTYVHTSSLEALRAALRRTLGCPRISQATLEVLTAVRPPRSLSSPE
jgi:Ca-activated chloride channel family protein